MAELNYANSGVDREAADRLVERITGIAKATLNRRVKSGIGGYASLFELDRKRWLAASTDGVGTKLKLAFEFGVHDTVGIDLVAMSVNDLLCVGAEPLFFLDYFATGKLDSGVAEKVLEGIVEGCRQARSALVGGETAEMPEFYGTGEYDLAGFAVGVLQPNAVLPKKEVKPGDVLIGIASSGAHSNGFSLLRKLLPSDPAERERIARQLLMPTRIYAKSLLPLIAKKQVKGLAHITGSGFLNVPRISDRVSYQIRLPDAKDLAPIYQWITHASGLSLAELATTFNLGIGMVAVTTRRKAFSVLRHLKKSGERAWVIGEVTRKRGGAPSEVILSVGGQSATLTY